MLIHVTFWFYGALIHSCIFNRELETDNCSKFINGMDGAVKELMATAFDQTKKHQGHYKREYQRIGHAFTGLGQAFEEPPCKFHKLAFIYRFCVHVFCHS